jgi:hypothetical protein
MLLYDEDMDLFYHDSCPGCHVEWDEIDIEYQICSVCGYECTKKDY